MATASHPLSPVLRPVLAALLLCACCVACSSGDGGGSQRTPASCILNGPCPTK